MQDLSNVPTDYFKCDTCKDEDHEEWICRCVSRNIRIAKIRRQRGELIWRNKNTSSQDEKEE